MAPNDAMAEDSTAQTAQHELRFYFPHKWPVVQAFAAQQKLAPPVYDGCKMTVSTDASGQQSILYDVAVPWYLRWLLPEKFEWEDTVEVNVAEQKRTEIGRSLTMPETYKVHEVSTWSASADGVGTDYLKTVELDVSYLPDVALQQIASLVRRMSLQTRQRELAAIEAFYQNKSDTPDAPQDSAAAAATTATAAATAAAVVVSRCTVDDDAADSAAAECQIAKAAIS